MLSENSSDLYNTVWNTSSLWGIKKEPGTTVRPLQLFQESRLLVGFYLAVWGEVLKLMELTGEMQELEDSWCTLVYYGFPTSLMNQPCE